VVLSLANEQHAAALRARLRAAGISEIEVVHGAPGTVRVATHPEVDFVVSAIVGVSGLEATYEAVRAGKTVGLGQQRMSGSRRRVDHRRGQKAGQAAAAHRQRTQRRPPVPARRPYGRGRARVWLTASGGPFLHTPKSEFASITVQQALNHPTWKMGKRITIDSATLMNKGFEVIEACRLFHLPPERVQVIVHPQSTIHSLVEFVDGSILAQISVTDMRLPILYALTYPERIPSDLRFSINDLRRLDFCPPDLDKFPCLALAYEAAATGGAKTIALNAADEVAVAAFLDEQIDFQDIPRIIEEVMAVAPAGHLESIQKVLTLDTEARLLASAMVKRRRRKGSPIRSHFITRNME
jgi:1-deoxy-D-xylulose-5-phosphate reductoisomerase